MFKWLIPSLAFVIVFIVVRAFLSWLGARRLHKQALAVTALKDDREKKQARSWKLRLLGKLSVVGAWQENWIPASWGLAVEKKLVRQDALPLVHASQWLAIKEVSLVCGVLAGLAVFGGWGAVLLGCAAYVVPDLWLKERIDLYIKKLLFELPDFLDLLAACMYAGINLEQALQLIIGRDRDRCVCREFSLMLKATQMGVSRSDALRQMGERVGHPDILTLITALIQAERLGVQVAETLKGQATRLRTKHIQRIEKQALEAPVKMLFPLIIFIFPVVFLILFGPILVRFMQGF